MNLAGADLNLLVALDALLRERNVTRAAKTVGLSQPAMSNALGRLRRLLDDPILVRSPDGMQPTPRAEALAGPLAAALRQIDSALFQRGRFDPATAEVTFNIATQDYEQLVLVPPLTARLAREAPRVRLHFTSMRDRLPVEDLYLGRIDLAIGVHGEVHGGLFKARLIDEGFKCALRKDHPEAGRRLTLARFAALEHLLISPFGGMTGTVDAALAEHGLTRTVKLAVPQFAVAPWILLDTDYVLTLPERIAERYAAHLPLRLFEPPLDLPRFSEWMFWHERTHSDPAHQWLRQVLREIAGGR